MEDTLENVKDSSWSTEARRLHISTGRREGNQWSPTQLIHVINYLLKGPDHNLVDLFVHSMSSTWLRWNKRWLNGSLLVFVRLTFVGSCECPKRNAAVVKAFMIVASTLASYPRHIDKLTYTIDLESDASQKCFIEFNEWWNNLLKNNWSSFQNRDLLTDWLSHPITFSHSFTLLPC